MREINRNNQIRYSYEQHKFSDGVIAAIILIAISFLLLIVSILCSYIFMGEAPSFVGGIGLASIFFDIASMANVVLEIYLYRNFHTEIRTLLLLQLIILTIWIFII